MSFGYCGSFHTFFRIEMISESHLRSGALSKATWSSGRAIALYVIESRGTVRSAAKKFGISKSTVHKDLSERLPAFNRGLYLQVKQVLEENKAQRHIRGGLATRRKYKGE